MMYLLTATGLSPGGSTNLHTNNTQNNTNNNRTTNVEECGPCPVFASFTLAFALQLRKKHGKASVRVRKTSVRLRKTSVTVHYTYYQNTHTLQQLYSFMTTALEGGEGSASRPGRSLPPGKTRCPLYRRVGGPQGRSGQVRKVSPPPGFDPRTVQPVASRYTDQAK